MIPLSITLILPGPHRPWWKVAINTVLRLMQPGVERKWVVFSRFEITEGPPKLIGYGFGRIKHDRGSEVP